MRSWTWKQWVGAGFIIAGILAMVFFFIRQEIVMGIFVAFLPLVIICTLFILENPYWGLMLLFAENYFLMGISRYVSFGSIGMLTDLIFGIIFLTALARSAFYKDLEWKRAYNAPLFLYLVWLVYCLLEIANPTALSIAWMSAIRSLTIYPLLVIIITPVVFYRYRDLKRILFLWAVFTSLAVLKMQMQKTMGFDNAETYWLMTGTNFNTHILSTGIRYFSFFTDAGNFGSNMGCAFVVFSISAFFAKKKWLKIFFILIGLAGLYAMFVSGTRGAIAVPFAGFILYVLLSKNTKTIGLMVLVLVCAFVFFKYSTIGNDNQYIRRMRTAFDLNDPSLVVRLENQEKLAEYMKTRPFGEGIGLSGGEAQRFESRARLTTSIANDSWYVKIWVETGIVGLIIYLILQLSFIVYGIYLVLFKIKDRELKGYLSAILCGLFGMMVSAYGNPFFGQYPTCILMAMVQAFIFLAPVYDKEIETNNNLINNDGRTYKLV